MSPFASGALGAATVLLLAGLVRNAVWHRRSWRRGMHRSGPFFLRRLYTRLGTRREQEQVLSSEADALAKELRALREDAHALRAEVADMIAAPALDAATVQAAIEARLVRLDAVKTRLADGLSRVHAALDAAQRTELAELLRRGPHRFWAHVG